MGTPFISTAVVREHNRDLEKQARRSRKPREEVGSHLVGVRLFAGCGKKEIRAISKAVKLVNVYRGTQIITEGEDGNTMYVILDGTARVSRNGRKLVTAGPGSAFGELSLLSKGPRTATVVAETDMEVAVLSRKQLYELLEDAPGFARKLLESLADTVRELDKKLV